MAFLEFFPAGDSFPPRDALDDSRSRANFAYLPHRTQTNGYLNDAKNPVKSCVRLLAKGLALKKRGLLSATATRIATEAMPIESFKWGSGKTSYVRRTATWRPLNACEKVDVIIILPRFSPCKRNVHLSPKKHWLDPSESPQPTNFDTTCLPVLPINGLGNLCTGHTPRVRMQKMRRIRVPVLVAVAWIGLLATGHCQQGVRWETSLENAQQLAAQTNRLVLIHFGSPQCSPCRQMDATVYNQPAVAAALAASYVCVRINADTNPVLKAKYGVTGLPSMVTTTPRGEVVDVIRGYVDATQYTDRLNLIAADVKRHSPVFANMPAGNPQQGNASLGNVPTGGNPSATNQPTAFDQSSPPQSPARQAAFGTPQNPHRPAEASPSTSAGLNDNRYAEYFNRNQSPATAGPAMNMNGGAAASPAPMTQMSPPTTMSAGTSGFVPSPPSMVAPQVSAAMGSQTASPATSPYSGTPTTGMSTANSMQQTAVAGSPAVASPSRYAAQPQAFSTSTPASQSPGLSPGTRPQTPVAAAGEAIRPQGSENAAKVSGENPPFGLDGYCPVALCEKQQWVLGDRRWGAVHLGRTYLFSGEEEQRRFFADPNRYAPVASGYDVVLAVDQAQTVPGMRSYGVFYADGHVYLFASEASLEKFSKNPSVYVQRAAEALRASSNPGRQIQ